MIFYVDENNFNTIRVKYLTHWGRGTHICVSKLTITGSGNGLSPGRRQAIIWTNDRNCWLDPWEQTSVKSESKFIRFHSGKCIWKCRLENGDPFYLGLNVLSKSYFCVLSYTMACMIKLKGTKSLVNWLCGISILLVHDSNLSRLHAFQRPAE